MENIFDKISGYYETLIDQHGHNPRSCDYGSELSQAAKFEVLSQVCSLKDRTLLDVGCGFADYANFLNQKEPSLVYHGVDITPSMIKVAKENNPNLSLRVLNILADSENEKKINEKYDIVTANGIFYLLGENAEKLMYQLIKKMFETANVAVAFNSLSSLANDKDENEFYPNPLETLAFCQKITPWVTLRQDYHSRDFTIYMYKEQNK